MAPKHPIWAILEEQGRMKKWLAKRTRYNESYVRQVACGYRPTSDEFRRRCAEALDLPEHVLFLCPESSTVARKVQPAVA